MKGLGERSPPGQIWVTIAKPGNIKRGDRLRLLAVRRRAPGLATGAQRVRWRGASYQIKRAGR